MSDYLSRLVARSLDRTEVIKPRLASFFEPSVQGEPVFGDESGLERLDASSTSGETAYDDLQSVWLSDQAPQLKPAALQPAWSGSQQTLGQPRLGTTQQAPSSPSSVSPEVTAQSSGVFAPSNTASPAARSSGGKTPQQKSSQDLPAPPGGDETYMASPGDAAERNRSSAHEPAIQPITIKSSPPTSPEVTAQQSAVRMVQQESDHEMLTPSSPDDGETYHLPPRVTAKRNRESTREPAIQPITIESSPPTSPEVTAQQSAARVAQQESDHETLTPLSSGDGETYHLPPQIAAERSMSSARKPAIQPIMIERITSPEKTRMQVSEPAEPAVIRVTIGRIEVRATTPPQPPAPRTHTPGPALTLDDYLKQRNGGPL